MATKEKSVYIPTGFESEQRAAERKRKIAQAMLEKGLGGGGPMQSWTQVLSQMGNAFVGKRLDKKADEMDDATDLKILDARDKAIDDFTAGAAGLREGGGDYDSKVRELYGKAGKSPFLSDQSEMLGKAVGGRIEELGKNITWGDQNRQLAGIKEGEWKPNDPNSPNWRSGPDGRTIVPNPVGIATSLAKQPNVDIDPAAIQQVSMLSARDPMAPSQQTPQQGAPSAPPAAPAGDGIANVLSKLDPQERTIVNGILQKYTGASGPPGGSIPTGSPTIPPSGTGGGKPPDGVTNDGQPYWNINGVPYDNPEGR